MSWRAEGDIQADFTRVARELDQALGQARAPLGELGISLYDWSNRTGFDKSGMGNPTWCYEFERRRKLGSFVAKAVARIEYIEPTSTDASIRLEASWVSEVFQIASLPAFRKTGSETATLDLLVGDGLLAVVKQLVDTVEKMIPPSFTGSSATMVGPP